jgi:hypothetical protein
MISFALALIFAPQEMRYLDNGKILLGVDLNRGGAITYLSRENGPNLVNDFDLGRQIQMSYYSGPVPFEPRGKKPNPSWAALGWNPIQSGDCYGNPSKTISFEQSKTHLHLVCIPMQWPLENEPGECTFESDIALEGNVVKVTNTIHDRRSDHTQYTARAQELPAVYTNGPWYHLFTYSGDRPYEDQPLTEVPHGFPWTSYRSTECWNALVDDHDDGLGVWAPGTVTFSGGFAGQPGRGGEHDSPTGYIAPNQIEILDWNIDYTSRYSLIVGNLKEIRSYVYAHAGKVSAPSYKFEQDRQHWTYVNATDAGWPIAGALHLQLEKPDPQMIGPAGNWRSSANVLEIDAACHLSQPGSAQLFWARSDAPGFSEDRSMHFPLISDGKPHHYRIPITSPEYRGTITQLRFDPEPNGAKGDWMRVSRIAVS